LSYTDKRRTSGRPSLLEEENFDESSHCYRPGIAPVFGEFQNPVAQDGFELVIVKAAALSNLTKGRASGSHYSAENQYPFVPGVDGVSTTQDGARVYFVMPEAPFGAMAERTLVDLRRTLPVPENLDDVAAAALANPGMSCWAALVERAAFSVARGFWSTAPPAPPGRLLFRLPGILERRRSSSQAATQRS